MIDDDQGPFPYPLPDTVRWDGAEYEALCCMCHEWKPLLCGPEEVEGDDYEHYCGGSPRCCP
jgi:hypothetical protein